MKVFISFLYSVITIISFFILAYLFTTYPFALQILGWFIGLGIPLLVFTLIFYDILYGFNEPPTTYLSRRK